MRKLLIAALLIVSCDGAGRHTEIPSREAIAEGAPSGVDLLVLRVPRGGGRARVFNYPGLDSIVWSSPGSVPAIARVLSFDVKSGSLLYSDSRSIARSLDFRLSAVSPATQLRLSRLATADGWNVYGVSENGSVGRSTPAAIFGGAPPAPWSFRPSLPAREVFPLINGSLLVVGADDSTTMLWRLFPPEVTAADSLRLESTNSAFSTPTGDRLFFTVQQGLLTITSKDFQRTSQVQLRGDVREVVPTPSGNQLFLVGDSTDRVHILDRYDGKISGNIHFPRPVRTVRMDPLGRFLLASSFAGDSAWLVPISNYRNVRAVATGWRPDLPYVAWDGSLVVVRGRDVQFLDPITLSPLRSVSGGAAEFWHFFTWNGFRPRPPGTLDPPVNFPVFVDHSDFELPRRRQVDIDDSIRAAARADSIARADSARTQAVSPNVFTVSFAVLRSDSSAAVMARGIRVRGQTARVVASFIDATPIFRVVLGPYATREEAETVGRASGKAYWVYQGPP